LTNSQPSDQLVSTETKAIDKNKSAKIYLFTRISLFGLISVLGAVSVYYFHSDIVATAIVSAGSTLTLLPVPSIIKSILDFNRDKKAKDLQKDKLILDMTIKTTVDQQQKTSNEELKEFILLQLTGVKQEIVGVNQRIDGVNQDGKNNFDSLTQTLVGVRQNSDAIENQLNSRLIAASSNSVDIQKQLIDLDRKVSSGQTEAHNDIQALNNRITELSKFVNDQIATVRQRNNPQE
jgi:hypothetical protein